METVKGFRDFLGEEAVKRKLILDKIREIFELYGFEPAETPIIEYEEFVKKENQEDDAVRDIFKLKDRGGRKLALRYEFTFQLKRISKNKKLPFKRYQIGYNFRDEPIKKGRLRQFIQCDADIVGATIKDEAENFAMLKRIFKELKIPVKTFVNSRKLLNEILKENKVKEKYFEDVIRLIDKLDKLGEKEIKKELKKYNAEKVLEILKNPISFFKKYSSYQDIEELERYCKMFGVEIEFKPTLARGFSYYTGNVFEVWSKKLGVSLVGGGTFMVNGIQSTGFGLGLEPVFLLADIEIPRIDYILISLNQDRKTIKLAEKLRSEGKKVIIFYGKPSKALEYANSYKISNAIFIGEKEANSGKAKVKNLKTGKESFIKI